MKIAIFAILITLFIQADNSREIIYQNDYNIAMEEAKKDNKYLFILVTSKGCGWCKKLKKTTLQEPEVIEGIDKKYIAVELNQDNNNYPKSLKVDAVPTVLIVDSKSGETIKAIVGYRANKRDYTKWFSYVDNLED